MTSGNMAWCSKATAPFIIALFSLAVFGTAAPPEESGYLFYGIVVALMFCLSGAWCWKYSENGSPFGGELSERHARVLIWLTALLTAAAIFKLGMIQFGGFDHSALIDMGWRIHLGQKPFRDFPCTMPPLFYLGAGWAFDAFGVSWRSLVVLTAVFSFTTFLWSYFLLKGILEDRFGAWLFSLMIQACTTVVVSYWWYNPVTTVVAVLCILSFWRLFGTPEDWWVRVSCVGSLALLSLAKPNIAGLLIVGTLVIGLFSGIRWVVIAIMVLSAIISLVTLAVASINPVDLVAGYLGIAARGATLNQLFQDIGPMEKVLFTGVVAAILIPWMIHPRHIFSRWNDQRQWLALLGLIAGLYGFITNGEAKTVDVPMVIICSMLGLCILLPKGKSHSQIEILPGFRWKGYFSALASVLIGIACAQAVTRHRVETIGPGLFFEHRLSDRPPAPPFFMGLRTGDVFPEVCSEVDAVLSQSGRSSVYFGPRMQWAYAAFGVIPPLNQPSWWHPGVSFPKSMEDYYIKAWASGKFDTVVFFKNDLTYMSPEFIEILSKDYSVDQSSPLLTVLHRIHVP
jgi:hypothetical protein